MAYSVEVASQTSRRSGGLPRLVPVFVGPWKTLPRQIEVALEGRAPISAAEAEGPIQAAETILPALREALAPLAQNSSR